MKEEQGITLISLIVYVMLMTFIVAIISSITASFYTNVSEFDTESESAVAFSKFNMVFINDIKRENAEIYGYSNDYVILSYTTETVTTDSSGVSVSGTETEMVEYLVQNNILYRNKVKICENVNDILFTVDTTNNTINVNMIIGEYEKSTTYVVEDMSGSQESDNSEVI